jgi:hypothetical protein
MRARLDPFSFLVVSVAGWLNQSQQQAIEYLVEENRILREQIGRRRLRFSDNQRRRLAAKAKKLSRKVLSDVATIVTRNIVVASETDRKEVRWQRFSWIGPSTNFNGHFEYRDSHGRRESRLELAVDLCMANC